MGDRNQMSVMPVPAADRSREPRRTRALAFSHDDEIAQPDLYRVTLQNGLIAEMSPTDHGGIMRFTFPPGGDRKPRLRQRHVHHRYDGSV